MTGPDRRRGTTRQRLGRAIGATFRGSVGALVVTVAVVASAPGVAVAAPASSPVAVHHYQDASAPVRPHEVVVLGDSTALALGYALAATAPPGTTVVNGGLFGCGLAIASWFSDDPPSPKMAMTPRCRESTPDEQQWPAVDAARVAGTRRGDIVLFLAGYWEVMDLFRAGHWTDISQPSFRRYELGQLRELIRIASSHGAHVDLASMPAMADENDTVSVSHPDSSRRRIAYNRLLRTAARESRGTVSVIGFSQVVSPKGDYREYLDGVQVRSADGVHTPAYAPGNVFADNAGQAVADRFYNWISPRLWPTIIASDRPARSKGRTSPH